MWYLLLSSHVSSQDTFLPHVECGTITLIGATTENPSFQVNSALLSRCRVLVLERLSVEAMGSILRRAVDFLGLQVLNGDASEICSEWVSVVPLLSQRVWDPSSDFTLMIYWWFGLVSRTNGRLSARPRVDQLWSAADQVLGPSGVMETSAVNTSSVEFRWTERCHWFMSFLSLKISLWFTDENKISNLWCFQLMREQNRTLLLLYEVSAFTF